MLVVSFGEWDNWHEMSKPMFFKIKKKYYINLWSTELAQRSVKIKIVLEKCVLVFYNLIT